MNLSKINKMYTLSFLFTLHISLSAYVNSTFLTSIIKENYVGILYTVASIFTILLLSRSANILKHFGNKKLILIFLMINMMSLVGIIISKNPKVIGASFIALITTNTLIMLCLDIFIEHFEDAKKIAKSRSIYLTIINLAWMISPLITAFILTKEGGYKMIYTIAFIATIIMTIGLLFSVKTFKDKKYKKTPFLETYRYLKTNKHMLAIVIINFILQFFFALMVVYTPIYLSKYIGLGWNQIGIIFTVMLAPFIIFSLPTGLLIEKYHVKKRTMLVIGFIIMSISTFVISFIAGKNIIIWASILFLTRAGASIVETTSEIYFFTHVKEEDTFLLGIFRDMVPMAYLVAPLVGTMIFVFLPFKYLFIILSLITISGGLYYIPHLKHNHEHTISNQN